MTAGAKTVPALDSTLTQMTRAIVKEVSAEGQCLKRFASSSGATTTVANLLAVDSSTDC